MSGSWEDHIDGELTTMRSHNIQDEDPQEKTIRPSWKLPPPKARKQSEPDLQQRRKSSSSPRKRPVTSQGPSHHKQKSQSKNLATKFELPTRPDAFSFKEQAVEDYSDLFGDDEHDTFVFNQRVGQMKKVCAACFPTIS